MSLTHLDQLEAEAIYIFREVAAECERPVMLYSIGKDSSVMLHLAMKAFYPEKPPFPFLHIDTSWKFREMIAFRDQRAKELNINMLVYRNEEAIAQGINPFDHGAAYTDIMKTQALKDALTKYQFTAAFGGGRRDEEKSRAKERIFPFGTNITHGIPKTSARRCGNYTIRRLVRVRACASSLFPIGQKRISGNISGGKISALYPCILQKNVLSFIGMETLSW